MKWLKKLFKNIWLYKFAILGFLFVWVMPLVFIGTKIKYVETNVAVRIFIYGYIALYILYRGFKKQIQDWLMKKYGVKGLRDYLVKKQYSFKRGLLLEVVMWLKLSIATFLLYRLSVLLENAYSNWLLILGLLGIGSMFRIIHNIVMKGKVQNEEIIS